MQMNRSDHEIWEKVRKKVCSTCSDEYCYEINGDLICEDRLDMYFRKAVYDIIA